MSKVVVNLKGLEKQVKNLVSLPMEAIGIRALELNKDQIGKKQNKDGSRFKPYTSSYSNRKGVGQNDVDLTSKASAIPKSNNKPYATMVKAFNIISVQNTKIILGFNTVWDRQKASYNVTGGKNKQKARPFVGLMAKNRRKLLKFAYKLISKGTY